MDFNLTGQQKTIHRVAKEFREKEIEPIAAKIDRENKIPDDMVKKMARVGLLGVNAPKKYGGSQAGNLSFLLAQEEIGYACSSCFIIVHGNNSLCNAIEHFGTDEQKEKYIRPLCRGEAIGSTAFTEPATGSDPKAITTIAVPDGDYYILNGTKRFITSGNHSGPGIFYAKDETGGVSAFIVDKNTEGYSTSAPWGLMGLGGDDVVDVYLKDVRVPKSNLFGPKSDGMGILYWVTGIGSRLSNAIATVGMAQAALDESIKYAKERTVKGKHIASTQSIQFLLAEMAAKIEAARWMTYRCGFLADQGVFIRKEASMDKLFVGHVGVEVADMALQVHGAYGFTKDFKIERIYRAMKYLEIVEGTSEVQRSIIAKILIS